MSATVLNTIIHNCGLDRSLEVLIMFIFTSSAGIHPEQLLTYSATYAGLRVARGCVLRACQQL